VAQKNAGRYRLPAAAVAAVRFVSAELWRGGCCRHRRPGCGHIPLNEQHGVNWRRRRYCIDTKLPQNEPDSSRRSRFEPRWLSGTSLDARLCQFQRWRLYRLLVELSARVDVKNLEGDSGTSPSCDMVASCLVGLNFVFTIPRRPNTQTVGRLRGTLAPLPSVLL
jgi:hypothetical protein